MQCDRRKQEPEACLFQNSLATPTLLLWLAFCGQYNAPEVSSFKRRKVPCGSHFCRSVSVCPHFSGRYKSVQHGQNLCHRKNKTNKTASKQKQTTERPESYTPQGYAPVTQTPPLKIISPPKEPRTILGTQLLHAGLWGGINSKTWHLPIPKCSNPEICHPLGSLGHAHLKYHV